MAIDYTNFRFENVDVKEELTKALKKTLPKYGFNAVKVIKADPQSPSEIPCVGINRIDDNETEQSIADSHITLYDRGSQENKTYFGSFFQESMEIRVWHTNADERDKLYRHTKAILFAIRTSLAEKGLLNTTLRAGRDEQDTSQAQAPVPLYWSSITMSYLNPLDVELVDTVAPITSITDTMLDGYSPSNPIPEVETED